MSRLPVPDAFDDCAREPIHIPGAIQPHGALLAFSLPTFEITHRSENCEAFVGVAADFFPIGGDLRSILPRAFLHDLGNVLQAASIARAPERLLDVRLQEAGPSMDVIAHVTADGAICEFMPTAGLSTGRADSGVLLRAMVARLSRAATADRLLSMAAQQVRAVTGFDRVMIYKFRADHSGVVVAESLRNGIEPYLGLHYPASDIPPQARELYRRQPLRQIPRVDYRPVPILPQEPGSRPLDLSLAHLRSVSPVHLEYLRNMGSVATLTVSILRGGALWGLIACHHEMPRQISSSTCAALELFAQMFSLQLEAREQAAELAEVAKARAALDALRDASPEHSLSSAIGTLRRKLDGVLPHDGVALWIAGQAEVFGSTPPADRIPELARHIEAAASEGLYVSSCLSADLPDALTYTVAASGVLAVPLSRGRQDLLLFFRKEQLQTVSWGGDPNKPVTIEANGGRIGPRQSFAAWREVVRGASLPWSTSDTHVADALQRRVLEFMLSHARVVDEGHRATADNQSLLIAELGHRVKNIFALIRSVVRQSRAGAASVDSYAADLERRIGALAIAHDQATHAGWQPASLRRLLEEQALTWSNDEAQRIRFSGPPVLLDVRAVQAFALVLHELMTNAAKYGALSTNDGTVAIAWEKHAAGLSIAWRERGGPPVLPSERRGFGSTVIEQTIPFELMGTTAVAMLPGGVEVEMVIPADYVTLVKDEPVPAAPSPVHADLVGKRVLLVEDSMIIALDAQSALEAIGATVDIVASVADGLRAIGLNDFSAAVLDVNLRGETSAKLADSLAQMKIPFVFATGYGDRTSIPERFRFVPKVSKPYNAATIAQAIEVSAALRPQESAR